MKAPASSIPAMLAARSNAGLSASAAAAAAPSGSPAIEARQKAAPPGGKPPDHDLQAGPVTSASSGSVASIRPTGPSLRLAAKMVTAGKRERTIRVAGCGVRTVSASRSGGIEAKACGASGSASAA